MTTAPNHFFRALYLYMYIAKKVLNLYRDLSKHKSGFLLRVRVADITGETKTLDTTCDLRRTREDVSVKLFLQDIIRTKQKTYIFDLKCITTDFISFTWEKGNTITSIWFSYLKN